MNKYSGISAFAVDTSRARTERFADWPLALKSIFGFWLVYALTVAARATLSSDPGTALQNKLIVLCAGIGLTALVYASIRLLAREASIRWRIITAAVSSALAAIGMSVLIIAADGFMHPSREENRYQAREGIVLVEQGNTLRIERSASEPLVLTMPRINELDFERRVRIAADTAVIWFFFFSAWSAFYLAMVAQAEALGARRRAAEAESTARAAQVRALRYQVNPHFLFNTLNSLSSLVMSSRPAEAESMILNLSTFLRSSLSLDPSADVTLAEEIELQRLYLDIERVRFPRRLKVEIDVPQDLENARLPALILQPVVENAIKYGVSPTREKVVLRITAREAGPGRFTVEVSNSGKLSKGRREEPPSGTGLGLGNVSERLKARFGNSAHCAFGELPDGGYRVVLTLPLDRGDA